MRRVRRGSGDGTSARRTTQHGRPIPAAAAANSHSREGQIRAGMGVGSAHSTDEAGNDRRGKGPKLKGQRRKRQEKPKESDASLKPPAPVFRRRRRRCMPKPRHDDRTSAARESMNLLREPDAVNPHVRFDEREVETERLSPPRHLSTLPVLIREVTGTGYDTRSEA